MSPKRSYYMDRQELSPNRRAVGRQAKVRFGSMLSIKSATSSARATIESKYRVF